MSSQLYSNSIFWIDIDKIFPNPYQPRREFNEAALKELSESIRQYGILQPVTVSRIEREKPDGGIVTEYELIAGERRLRASKLAGLSQIPAVIRVGDDNMMKLELAIIENLQREDLNAVDRARAFMRLVDEFKFTHAQVGQKVGKSREYVSNSLRLLSLPQAILDALSAGQISEGHTRPLMMLGDKPEEQVTLFKEVLHKKITVREAERIARHIAVDKVRKKDVRTDPEILAMETQLRDVLGTRVHIENREVGGGQIMIDFFSKDDLENLISMIQNEDRTVRGYSNEDYISRLEQAVPLQAIVPKVQAVSPAALLQTLAPAVLPQEEAIPESAPEVQAEPALQMPFISAYVPPVPVVEQALLEYVSHTEEIPTVFYSELFAYARHEEEIPVVFSPEILPPQIQISHPDVPVFVSESSIESQVTTSVYKNESPNISLIPETIPEVESEQNMAYSRTSDSTHYEISSNLPIDFSDLVADLEKDLDTNPDFLDDRSEEEIRKDDDTEYADPVDLYSVRGFEV